MDVEKIRKHNREVDYNKSASSWIMDIIACIIFFPMIIMVVYRRGRYNKYLNENEGGWFWCIHYCFSFSAIGDILFINDIAESYFPSFLLSQRHGIEKAIDNQKDTAWHLCWSLCHKRRSLWRTIIEYKKIMRLYQGRDNCHLSVLKVSCWLPTTYGLTEQRWSVSVCQS